MNNCLYCYKPLSEKDKDFHSGCIKKFFGTIDVPSMDYTIEQLEELALQVIQDQTSLTGVQPKLSLHLNKHDGCNRLTIVGLWGAYICKPQTTLFKQLPENEDLTMHLAELSRINTVPHTLMRMADNSICYITSRIDRTKEGGKLAMEDMCQLTERPTEYKYKSSYEQIGKTIQKYSSVPKMDIINFFELVLFCWITGNNDMHLKNFSIYETEDGGIQLSPAYDLLNVVIINPEDDEELALTLNGKKKKINRKDFLQLANTLGIDAKIVENLFKKYQMLLPKFINLINISFLDEDLKEQYAKLINQRMEFIR